MSPTLLTSGPYRFFFNSRKEPRRHAHVSTASGTAQFWPEPLVALDSYHNLSTKELHQIEQLVKEHKNDFREAWDRHFGQ